MERSDVYNLVRPCGEYTSSCGYCHDEVERSVAFGMMADSLSVQVLCPSEVHLCMCRIASQSIQRQNLWHFILSIFSGAYRSTKIWDLSVLPKYEPNTHKQPFEGNDTANLELRTLIFLQIEDNAMQMEEKWWWVSCHLIPMRSHRLIRICWIGDGAEAEPSCINQIISKPVVHPIRIVWTSTSISQTRFFFEFGAKLSCMCQILI